MRAVKITRNGKLGIVAVVAVALVAAGAAFAATQFHGSSVSAARGGFGGGPGFVPRTGAYGAPGFGRPDGDRGFGRRAFGLGGPGGGLSAAATYLGLSQTQLFQQLQTGKTLAQIANGASGKSAAGLIDAMVSAQQSQIAAAVKAGTLTQAMADRITADLKARISAMVNGSFGPGRRGFGDPDGDHGGFGFGPPGGGQAPQAPTTTTHI
jgi:hypothetical protein